MSTQLHDVDPIETKEWLDALSSVLEYEGSERAQYLLESLVKYSRDKGIRMPHGTTTPYLNTVPLKTKKASLATKTSNTASVHSFVGTLPLSFCARVKKIGIGWTHCIFPISRHYVRSRLQPLLES